MIESAGVVVLDWATVEPTVLCVRAYSNWDFPKGRLEPGESRVQAAVRELFEETELRVPGDVQLVGVSGPSITYGSGKKTKTATYFIGDRVSRVSPFLPVSPELGRPENDEFRWVPVSQLADLVPPRLAPVVAFVTDWVEKQEAR